MYMHRHTYTHIHTHINICTQIYVNTCEYMCFCMHVILINWKTGHKFERAKKYIWNAFEVEK